MDFFVIYRGIIGKRKRQSVDGLPIIGKSNTLHVSIAQPERPAKKRTGFLPKSQLKLRMICRHSTVPT